MKLGWANRATGGKMGLGSAWWCWWVAVWVCNKRQLTRTGTDLRDGSCMMAAWAARWVFLASHSLSFSLYFSLLFKSISPSLFVSPMAFSSSFFNLFFRLVLDYWVIRFTLFYYYYYFFFFYIYMGFGLADSVGWFRIFGGEPGLKRKGGPSLLLVFFWAQGGLGPP